MIIDCYGTYITKNRIALNLSQKDLAQKLNVSEASVSKWESDTMRLEINHLVSLAYMFDVSVEDFLHQRFSNNFPIECKYPILSKVSSLVNFTSSTSLSESDVKELLFALENMNKLNANIRNLDNRECIELNILLNNFVRHLTYKKYYDNWVDPVTGVIKSNEYIKEYLNEISVENIINLINNNDIKDVSLSYNISFEDILFNIYDKETMFDFLKLFTSEENDLLKAIDNEKWNLCLVYLLKGIRLTDKNKEDMLIKMLLSKIGDLSK